MDNSDELKKKADEFMEILRKKREEAEKLEKAREARLSLERFISKPQEKPKDDFNYLMRSHLSMKPFEIQKPKEVAKEKPKSASNWGCFIVIGVVMAIVFIFNGLMENFDDSSPWFIGGMVIYVLLILLAAMQGPKRRR